MTQQQQQSPNGAVGRPTKTSAVGLALIKRFEGCRLTSYQCPAGVWTVGYGSTTSVIPHATITQAEADARLAKDVELVDRNLGALVKTNVTQGQWDALASFAFNLGVGALKGSGLLKLANTGLTSAAAEEFLKWTHCNGKVEKGLVTRREAERKLWLGLA